MKHEDYQFMISLALDDDLSEVETKELNHHLEDCATCSLVWQRMQQMEALFTRPPEATPPVNFTTQVMARIEHHQRHRVTPGAVVMLVLSSLAAALTIAIPMLFLLVGVEGISAAVPWVGVVFEQLGIAYSWAAGQMSLIVGGFVDMLTLVVTNPFILSTALLALTIASIWIGVLESMKFSRMAVAQQSA